MGTDAALPAILSALGGIATIFVCLEDYSTAIFCGFVAVVAFLII